LCFKTKLHCHNSMPPKMTSHASELPRGCAKQSGTCS
jgi:hypothetical protein